MKYLFILLLSIVFYSCQDAHAQQDRITTPDEPKADYWNDGLAEVNRYELLQYRYGELRKGDLIQIFVPEEFLLDKQVKNESLSSRNSTRVLKRIETRQFNTGIYQYNMFSSAFTPFDQNRYPHALKLSSSAQEWCGTTYSQLNRTKDGYECRLFSYFEKEADRNTTIKKAISEEELFTRIRLDPLSLPQGKINLIPSQIVSRFLHLESRSYPSLAVLEKHDGSLIDGDDLMSYTLSTQELDRTVVIVFEKAYPYKILAWSDNYSSNFGKKKNMTTAVLSHQIKEAYWKFNSNSNEAMRTKLGLN